MWIKPLAKACAALLTMGVMAAPVHAEDLLSRVKKSGELVVGTEMQFAPFDFHENGKQTGFNKDLFEIIAERIGVKVKFLDLPWPSVLPGLDSKKFDMGGGPILVTKARKERYSFTLPVADGTVALLKSAKNAELTKPEDIAGLAVGGGKGSAQLAQLKDFVATLDKPVDVREYVDNNQAYADIVSGRLVAVANSITNIAYVAKQRPNMFEVVQPPFGKQVYFAYFMRKDEDSRTLLEAFNEGLEALHADGTLAELQKKWFGMEMKVPTAEFEPAV
ncbi:MAG TPA: transporter substrate-binding domain-containing protein [Alcaligenaceae bacterium]|uniref:transporter substrate-binding domain-containing protein n=1 Tax=Paenalcaligenes sp. TaxID=1966342 RepID=UPI001775BF69|nr:transporter substrate-binding domain-containing protein [Paenalcaligenes sp.]HHU94280.1 transporter substrate-binding domain-containing protein [Alcaligenaceae bacterium]